METDFVLSSDLKTGLKKVDDELVKVASSAGGKLREASLSTIRAGGKRLRPLLVLTSGKARNFNLEKLVPAAVSVELVHVASLIHDDVLDNAAVRRGYPTVNSSYGSELAVACGDFLFASAFEILSSLKNTSLLSILGEASYSLSRGEIKQSKTAYKISETISSYFSKVRDKTASLFAASCEIGAVISGASGKEREALRGYGESLGVAFQIYDDFLDIAGDEKVLGKSVGTDIKEGTLTLPVILALRDKKVGKRLAEIVKDPKAAKKNFDEAVRLIKETNVLERTKKEAEKYINKARNFLGKVKNKEVRETLHYISKFVIERRY